MELAISLPESRDAHVAVTGPQNRNLKLIREALGVRLSERQGHLLVSGEAQAVGRAVHVLEHLGRAAKAGKPLGRQAVIETIASSQAGGQSHSGGLNPDALSVYLPGISSLCWRMREMQKSAHLSATTCALWN